MQKQPISRKKRQKDAICRKRGRNDEKIIKYMQRITLLIKLNCNIVTF